MVKIGVIVCNRNKTCGGNGCSKSTNESDGIFKGYTDEETIEVVGWVARGGCPGKHLESASADIQSSERR